ncbi:MAG: glycosyltransferase family 4 protein [Planctomycetota bacterium]
MRVLFFLPSLDGYESRVKLLCELSQGLDRLYLMVGRSRAAVDLRAYPRVEIVESGFRPGRRLGNAWRANRLAARLIRQEKIDIVHDTFGNFLPLLWFRDRFARARFFCSFYVLTSWRAKRVWGGMPLWEVMGNTSLWRLFYNRWVERSVCRRADRVILQAAGLAERLRREVSIPEERIAVLPNNVDTAFWRPAMDSPRKSRRNGDPVRLLFVGSLGRSRGLFVLLETMRLLRQRGISAALTLIGGQQPFERDRMQKRIEEYRLSGSVALPGRLRPEEVRDAFHQNDLFLYQTINDGSPRVVLEAMACGIPIIASHHPGIDALDPNGEAIAFTPYGDAAGVARLVESFRQDPATWRKRALCGCGVAHERFGSERVAQAYLSLYHSVPAQR